MGSHRSPIRLHYYGVAEVVAFENVDKAGVALHQNSGKFNGARKNFAKSVGCSQSSAGFISTSTRESSTDIKGSMGCGSGSLRTLSNSKFPWTK